MTPAWPLDAGDAQRTATTAADDGFDVVAAMGGDGVVHHVANGLIGRDTALGVIPSGTTNVLARILGLPAKPERAASALLDATPVWSPTAHYVTERYGTEVTGGYATFAVGTGFDAEVVANAETRPHSKLHFGSLHYARTVASKLFSGYRHVAPSLRVDCEGRRVDAVSVIVAVHTPYTYFGAMPLKLARHREEGLVAIAIERLSTWRTIDVVGRALLGRNLDHDQVHVWHGFGKLIIEADPRGAVQADGESLGEVDALEIAPAPASLLLMQPSAE